MSFPFLCIAELPTNCNHIQLENTIGILVAAYESFCCNKLSARGSRIDGDGCPCPSKT